MATLTALEFPTAGGADAALSTVQELSTQNLIKIHDGAIVTWPEGKKKPKTRELNDMKSAGALSGAFWGMLFGLLFFIPILGAAMGALAGAFTDVGISNEFIAKVREKVTPGTSALFLLTSDAVTDRVLEAMSKHEFELVATNLSGEQEAQLREAFEHEHEGV
ncbi:MAG: DUF1269 domain-containing protein [Actinomycetota bacterium]|nr:DUF1269 domain-containing protein [Actinomycetota bacterium]